MKKGFLAYRRPLAPLTFPVASCSPRFYAHSLALLTIAILLGGCATRKPGELGRPGAYSTPVFAPTEPLLAAPACDQRKVVVFDLRTRLETSSFAPGPPFKAKEIGPVVYTPQGHLLAAFIHKNEITVWDTGASNLLMRLPKPKGTPFQILLSPDGRRAVLNVQRQTPELWDLETGRKIAALAQGSNSVPVCGFSPEGECLATADSARLVHLWNAGSGEWLADLPAQNQPIASVALGPKGERLLVSARGATLWTATGEALTRIDAKELKTGARITASLLFGLSLMGSPRAGEGLFSSIPCGRVTFAANGTYMAVVMPQGGAAGVLNSMFSNMGSAQEVHVFEVATGKHLAVVAKDSWLWSPAFSPDGRLVAVAGTTLEVWAWQQQPVQKGPYSGYHSPGAP